MPFSHFPVLHSMSVPLHSAPRPTLRTHLPLSQTRPSVQEEASSGLQASLFLSVDEEIVFEESSWQPASASAIRHKEILSGVFTNDVIVRPSSLGEIYPVKIVAKIIEVCIENA